MKCTPGCTCRRHISRPHTPEARAAISRAHAGEVKSPEHRAKIAEASRRQQAAWRESGLPAPNRGVKFSESARANMSAARRGNKNARQHGMTHTRTHNSWRDMLCRCYQRSTPSFASYGGRGIVVCERWQVFENFYADMGERPEGMTIDRINVDGNYEVGNCRWATPAQQRANQRPRKKVMPDASR